MVSFPLAQGASESDASALSEVYQRLEHVERLIANVDSVRPWDRDGLNSRIDELGIELVTELNMVASALLAADAQDKSVRRELVDLLDRAVTLSWRRIETLEERKAAEREQLPKFAQNPQADIARAFMADLTRIQMDYLSALINQGEIRRGAGMDAQIIFRQIRDRVALVIERLTGQIRLDAMSLAELRDRLSEKPLDENFEQAIRLLEGKQARNLYWLERIIVPGARLGIDVTEQRSLLIFEQGKVGVDLLQRDVFRTLWEEEFDLLRQTLVRNGPNVLFRLLLFSVVVLLAWIAARVIRHPVQAVVKRLRMSQLLRDMLVWLSGVVVFLVGIVVALAALGVSLGPMLAGIGVLGILAGIAVQDSLGNLAAGAMILIYRPYDVDDHVKVSGAEGFVKRMGVVATTIATFDNQTLVVPNGRIWGDTIVNFTASPVRRVDIKVSFAYSEDPDRVQAVLLNVLEEHEQVLKKPEPVVHMDAMEDSALTMMAKAWVRTESYWTTYWDLIRIIKKRFDTEGIEIPFPQRVVRLIASDDKADSTRLRKDGTAPVPRRYEVSAEND